MAYDYPDPYYQPEKLGLEIVAEADRRGLSYEFNMVVVWRRLADGKLFWESDAGCSCNTPFDRFHSVDELQPLPETASLLSEVLNENYDGEYIFAADRVNVARAAGVGLN